MMIVINWFVALPGILSISHLFSSSYHVEAEDATSKGVQIAKSRAGYSDTGYVTGFDADDDHVVFHFEAKTNLFQLTIGYVSRISDKGYDLTVYGQKVASAELSSGIFGVRLATCNGKKTWYSQIAFLIRTPGQCAEKSTQK